MVVRGLAPRIATASRPFPTTRKAFPVIINLEFVEDLDKVDDTAVVAFTVTEVVKRTAVIEKTVEELRAIAKHEAARGRDRLVDVDGIHDPLTDEVAVIDYDKLTSNETTFEFGPIQVA